MCAWADLVWARASVELTVAHSLRGRGSVGRSTSFSLSNTRCRRRLISGQRLVTLPQDVHTASWQTLGLGSAAVSVQCSAPTTRFKENMKNKQNCAAKMLKLHQWCRFDWILFSYLAKFKIANSNWRNENIYNATSDHHDLTLVNPINIFSCSDFLYSIIQNSSTSTVVRSK